MAIANNNSKSSNARDFLGIICRSMEGRFNKILYVKETIMYYQNIEDYSKNIDPTRKIFIKCFILDIH